MQNSATQWIAGTSTDPLAVGFNETTNSDARIFGADGNATMRSFSQDPSFFTSQCGSLLERMINTVPKNAQLTDVIEPLPVKPYQLQLSLNDAGKLVMSGFIRVSQCFSTSLPNLWLRREHPPKIFGTSAAAASASPANMPVKYMFSTFMFSPCLIPTTQTTRQTHLERCAFSSLRKLLYSRGVFALFGKRQYLGHGKLLPSEYDHRSESGNLLFRRRLGLQPSRPAYAFR